MSGLDMMDVPAGPSAPFVPALLGWVGSEVLGSIGLQELLACGTAPG